MNLLRKVAPDQRHPVASPVISSLKSLWRDSWGPRLEYILHNAILALLDYDQATQLGVGCGPLIGSVSFEPVERALRFRNCGSPFSKPLGLTPDPILGPRLSAYRGCRSTTASASSSCGACAIRSCASSGARSMRSTRRAFDKKRSRGSRTRYFAGHVVQRGRPCGAYQDKQQPARTTTKVEAVT